jgi:photosystem II stability/assembly factor-like uncharacterized protein
MKIRPCSFFLVILSVIANGCAKEPARNSVTDARTNSGNNLTRPPSEEPVEVSSIADVAFKDKHVWATYIGGTRLYRSEDGGETFETVTTPLRENAHLSFVDEKKGWAISESLEGGRVWRTDDGGISWKRIGEPDQSNSEFQLTSVKGLTFVDTKTGWLFDIFGAWRSSDGGEHWKPVLKLEDQPSSGLALHAVFLDAEQTRIATTRGIYISNNGGKNWDRTGKDTEFSGIYFLDSRTGWVVNRDSAQIERATDGGTTWTRLSGFDPRIDLRSLYFLNKQEGWAAGLELSESFGASVPINNSVKQWKGIVLHSSDGGRKWSSIPSPDDQTFHRIYFLDSNRGWLLGTKSLYRTVDGGRSWKTAFTP